MADVSSFPERAYQDIIQETRNGVEMRHYANRPENLVELLGQGIQRFGGREAVVDDHARLTFREFDQLCNNLAASLRELGIRKGDRVAILMPERAFRRLENSRWHSRRETPGCCVMLGVRGGACALGVGLALANQSPRCSRILRITSGFSIAEHAPSFRCFGSSVNGIATPGSDVDLCLILSGKEISEAKGNDAGGPFLPRLRRG